MALEEGSARAALFAAVALSDMTPPASSPSPLTRSSRFVDASSRMPIAHDKNISSASNELSSATTHAPDTSSETKKSSSEQDSTLGNGAASSSETSEVETSTTSQMAPVGSNVFTPYGVGFVKDIRSNSPTPYVVKLNHGGIAYVSENSVRWKKKLYEMTNQDKFEAALEHKEKGNQKFKLHAFKDAITDYELALIYARQVADEEIKPDCDKLMSTLFQNLSIAQVRQGMFPEAVHSASEALQLNAKNIKALFFRAKAQKLRGNFSDASRDLEMALEVDPSNTELRAEVESIRKELAANAAKERKMFGGMFKSNASPKASAEESNGGSSATPVPEANKQQKQQKQEEPAAKSEAITTNESPVDHQLHAKEVELDEKQNDQSVLYLAGGLAVVASIAAVGYMLLGKGKK